MGSSNILRGLPALNWATRGDRVILWSGTLADNPFERDPGTWGPAGLEALRACVDRLTPWAVEAGVELLLRPHARHVLCDVQRTLKLLHEWRERPVGLALDAASMLEASMLKEADDHFRRAYETLGAHARAVFVSNVTPTPEDEEAPIRLAPLDEGVASGERILSLLEACVAGHVPRIAVFAGDARRIAAGAGCR